MKSVHILSWIPFDLQACLPCYANKAASVIGSTSRFRFSAFLLSESKYFLFKKMGRNVRKIECTIIARLTNDNRLDVYWDEHNGIMSINWTRFSSNDIHIHIYSSPLQKLLQRRLYGTDIKRRFLWSATVSRAFYVRVLIVLDHDDHFSRRLWKAV